MWLHGSLRLEVFEAEDLPGEQFGVLSSNPVSSLLTKGLSLLKAACVMHSNIAGSTHP